MRRVGISLVTFYTFPLPSVFSLCVRICALFFAFRISFPFLIFIQQKWGRNFFFVEKICPFFVVVSSWKINTDRTEIWYFLVIKIYLLALSSQCISESNKLYHWVLFSESISLNILSRLLFQFFLFSTYFGQGFFFWLLTLIIFSYLHCTHFAAD